MTWGKEITAKSCCVKLEVIDIGFGRHLKDNKQWIVYVTSKQTDILQIIWKKITWAIPHDCIPIYSVKSLNRTKIKERKRQTYRQTDKHTDSQARIIISLSIPRYLSEKDYIPVVSR